MKDTRLFEQILEIKHPWHVENVVLNKEKKEIEVGVGLKQTKWACPECQKAMHIHEYKDRRWRHLDSCQFKTFITAKVPRVQCKEHGSENIKVPWAEKSGRFTVLFERFAIDVLLECSISATCDLLRISWDEADGIKQRAVTRGLSRKESKIIPHLGVDEKGFRGYDCVTLVANISNGKTTVEFVSDGNTQESLDAYWQLLSDEQREGVKSVSIDMWNPYKNSILANVPDPLDKIVYDRFHIMKHMNKAVNDVRIFEHNVFNEMGDETLKGTRQLWLYGEENLPEKYEFRLEKLKEKKLKTGRVWAIKELLRDFWDCKSVDEGTTFLKSWYNWAIRSKLEPVKKVARMVKNHLRNIVSYFKYHLTNAALEGINNKVQALIKKAYGYRNKKRFKIDILFHCGRLNLYPNIVQ